MPIIEARSQEARKAVSVRLSAQLLGLVDEYAAALSEERGYVIEQLILYALKQDREFSEAHGLGRAKRARMRTLNRDRV